jgi:hypothetical protein
VSARDLLAVALLLAPLAAAARERAAYPAFPASIGSPAAARTAAAVAHRLGDPLVAERLDVPADVLDDARTACLAAAGPGSDLAADARADALACAADLGADALPFLDDPAAVVRRAAAALAGARPDERARARLLAAAADADAGAAATALGALCAADPTRTRRELDELAPTRTRAAALLADAAVDRGQAARIARCLDAASPRRR